MADKPIASNLPADLPTNWQTNQIVSPNGTEVGLDTQHGFNYLAKQVNDAQAGVNTINNAFPGLAAANHTHTPAQIGADPSGSAAAVQANLNAHAGNTTAHLTAVERAAWNGKANTVTLSGWVPLGWIASGDYFYQNATVTGMLATDNPIADILTGSDNAANKLYAEAWGKVLRAVTYDGGVQVWCTAEPAVALPLQFKVVR